MANTVRTEMIRIPARARSREAASFVAQLDDLSDRMFTDLAGTSATALARQTAPGTNTAGMLLAHIAIVEVFWVLVATDTWTEARLRRVLGVGVDDDGMPLPAAGRPPAALKGRTLAWYRRLHDRARAHTVHKLRGFGPAAMDRVVARTRRDGTRERLNVRWILYHVLEHQAGHYGQLLLMRHLARLPRRGKP